VLTRQDSQPDLQSRNLIYVSARIAAVRVNHASTSFGELLRDHRRAAGLTQEELAERAGVSPRSISEMERGGAQVPRRDTVGRLARALGLTGPARDEFEELVDGRRRARPPRTKTTPLEHVRVAVDRQKHNLPRSLTSFIGREQELRELSTALATAPLLTIVGVGGVGKTRLAQELARTQAANYADGSWLIELAALADPSLVPGAVATAVGLHDLHAGNLSSTLAAYLSQKQVLLVLDNCEHLIDACAELVAHLLNTCPRVRVVATSREPLLVPGETIWRLLPLDLPDLRQALSLDQITRVASVRLFMERARAVSARLTLTPRTAPAIARICIGVDGIPLALELAAARTRMLTVEQLAKRLDQDPGVLVGTNRVGLPQHRTIRATIDWSHELLGEQEQMLLRRLSVFAGGCALVMAEAVCSAAGIERADVLELLAQLVDKSMVVVEVRAAVARYGLLEPIRQYALERLEASGEARFYHARHAAALLQLVQTAQAGGAGSDEISSLDRLELEHDNLRVALRWALTHLDGAAALRCSAALFRFWERRGHFQEGCAWLEQALAHADDAPTPERGWALNALAFLYWRGGDIERAQPIADQALAVNREAGTARDVAQALLSLGMIAYFRDDAKLAVARLEESVHLARQADYAPQLSLALAFLGRILVWIHGPQHGRAAAALEESLGLAQAAQSRYATGHALVTLGDLAWRQGNAERALSHWRQALEVRSELAERRGIAGCLERLALVLAASNQFEPAAWLFGAAEVQHRVLGIALRHDQEIDHLHFVGLTRQHLGASFATAWSAGQASTLDEAVNRALEGTRTGIGVFAVLPVGKELLSLRHQ
jgi:predicted ATPase/transcriptional regulator with XRE-family HTH domain